MYALIMRMHDAAPLFKLSILPASHLFFQNTFWGFIMYVNMQDVGFTHFFTRMHIMMCNQT